MDIVVVEYDPYQFETDANFLRSKGVRCEQFNQGVQRTEADTLLYQMINQNRLLVFPHETLTEHINNAQAKVEGESRLRYEKRNDKSKIDLLIALSMSNWGAVNRRRPRNIGIILGSDESKLPTQEILDRMGGRIG
jgi:phage terminase large subunit-like protein